MNAEAAGQVNKRSYLLTTPSRFELTLFYIFLGAHLVIGTDAGITDGWIPFVAWTFDLMVVWFVIRAGLALFRFRVVRPKFSRWIEAASMLAILAIIYTTTIGLAARIYLSEDPLRLWAMQAQSFKPRWSENCIPCGLFTVQATISKDDVTWMQTVQGDRFLNRYADMPCEYAGLVYCERGSPPARSVADGGSWLSYYHHIYGPWWLWLQNR